MKIALIQTSLIWESPEENKKKIEQIFEQLSKDTQLVVLPEMFTTGFSQKTTHADAKEETLRWMQEWSATLNCAIVGSVMTQEEEQYYNRMYFVKPNGVFSQYDKKHLFSFAGEDQVFTAGDASVIVEYLGWRFALFVCYDLRFPVWLRNKAPYYDVLLGVANWPKARIDAWDSLLKARAIENVSYAVGCNIVGTDGNGILYDGHSGVYDYFGKELALPSEEETIIYATLNKEQMQEVRKRFPVLKDADDFVLTR